MQRPHARRPRERDLRRRRGRGLRASPRVHEDAASLSLRRAAQHYHTTSWAPYTVGCFGPVESVDECKSLYQGDEVETEGLDVGKCGTGIYPIYTPESPEGYCYDADCPCFEKSRDRYGRNSNLTVAECACYNVCDEVSNTDCGSVSCDAMLASGDFHCADDFCPTCPKKNWCDKSCGFGTCADPVVADIAERRLKRLFA